MEVDNIMNNDSKEKDGLWVQVYRDAFQPVGLAVGRTLQALLFPLRGTLWTFEKIEKVVNEGLERRLKKVPDKKILQPAPEILYFKKM